MEIKSLAATGFDDIFKAFERAFAGYELQLNKSQLRTMFKRRGFDKALSFGAFDKKDIVAFTCNGTGDYQGVFTAYDTGTGTLENYRGQGLATRIFESSVPCLKAAGISRYLLEVLQHNTKAVSVYRKIGFEVTREFNYFKQENKAVIDNFKEPEFPYTVRSLNIEELHSVRTFWDFHPSWQNSMESVMRTLDDFMILGVYDDDKLAGYSVFEPVSGDVTQIAVDVPYRRNGIGSVLLREIIKWNRNEAVKIVNTDVRCESITGFLNSKNIPVRGKQFEMMKQL